MDALLSNLGCADPSSGLVLLNELDEVYPEQSILAASLLNPADANGVLYT